MLSSVKFEASRDKLFGIAYRITGSVGEAEDIVQETYIRWSKRNSGDIQNLDAWLSTVATRLSLDYLKSARHQRQSYIGPWLPEPLIESRNEPENAHQIDQSVTMALMVLLDQLSVTERASYILHDLFNYSFKDISKMLDHSVASCRKLASRSREKIRAKPKLTAVSSEQHQKHIDAFFKATRDADHDALLNLLSDDVVFHTDGGGKAAAARNVLVGRSEVLAWFSRVLTPAFGQWQKLEEKRSIEWFNGSPGLVLWQGDKAISAFSFSIERSRSRQIYVLRNPDKLKYFSRE